jgi:hypothetical protein
MPKDSHIRKSSIETRGPVFNGDQNDRGGLLNWLVGKVSRDPVIYISGRMVPKKQDGRLVVNMAGVRGQRRQWQLESNKREEIISQQEQAAVISEKYVISTEEVVDSEPVVTPPVEGKGISDEAMGETGDAEYVSTVEDEGVRVIEDVVYGTREYRVTVSGIRLVLRRRHEGDNTR